MSLNKNFLCLQDLDFDIKDDTSTSFRKLIRDLLYSPIEYDCNEFQRAINSLSVDETVLIEILTTRSNKQLKYIANLYPKCNISISSSFKEKSYFQI